MNRCPNCAAQNRDGAKFCTSCGFKLPPTSEPAAATSSERSPFNTTSYLPGRPDDEVSVQADAPAAAAEASDEKNFSTWESSEAEEVIELPGPGSSWDAQPPRDTAVPVSDEMVETLVGGFPTESWEAEVTPEESEDQAPEELGSTIEAPAPVARPEGYSAGIDHLLRIARDLENGLIELAEAEQDAIAPGSGAGQVVPAGLSVALAGLQSEDDLQPLRAAIETARERPRDVDVMLDLVLRAEAIATVLEERDRLKAAVESATGDSADTGDSAGLEEQNADPGDAIYDEQATENAS